jgi:hypothetical protein
LEIDHQIAIDVTVLTTVVRLEVSTAVIFWILVFWDIMPGCWVGIMQCFEATLHP